MRVDAVVLAALEVEFDALRTSLVPQETTRIKNLNLAHFLYTTLDLSILVARLPDPSAGNVISGIVATRLIAGLDPWLVVSFGTAGKVEESLPDQGVLYSKGVTYIDLRKEEEGGGQVTKLLPTEKVDDQLLRVAGRVRSQAEPEIPVREVWLASSEAVVKSKEAQRRQVVKNAVADAGAVDMEAFGVARAVSERSFEHNKPRRWLAIKVVTDKADRDKNDALQDKATANGARFLKLFFESEALRSYKEDLKVTSFPRSIDVFSDPVRSGVTERVNEFLEKTRPLRYQPSQGKYHGLVQSELTGNLIATHVRTARPRVFLHWRLTGEGVHWVEIFHLALLRRLSDHWLPHFLITDRISPMPHVEIVNQVQLESAKRLTKQTIRRLFSERGFEITFLSDLESDEENLGAYGARANSIFTLSNILASTKADPLGEDGRLNQEFLLWFSHIGRLTEEERACIVFCYHRRLPVYEQLKRFAKIYPSLIPTGDFKVGNRLAKFKRPGADLYVTPPASLRICRWIVQAGLKELRDFYEHLMLSGKLLPASESETFPGSLEPYMGEIGWDNMAKWKKDVKEGKAYVPHISGSVSGQFLPTEVSCKSAV